MRMPGLQTTVRKQPIADLSMRLSCKTVRNNCLCHATMFAYTAAMPCKADVIPTWSDELEMLARGLNRVGPDEVCCETLTARQCGILRTLADRPGAQLSHLAREAGITPSAMTRAIEKLEAQNLVRRVRGHKEDGRAASIQITERGRTMRQRIQRLMHKRAKVIVSAIPAGFRPQLLASLRMINQSLDPGGCCEFTGKWPDIGIACRMPQVTAPRKTK